jgi:tetratricopeptide (TPR) repeat protein
MRAAYVLPQLASARYFGRTPASDLIQWIDRQQAAGRYHDAMEFHRFQSLFMLGRVDEARAAHDEHHDRLLEFGAGVSIAVSCNMRAELELMAGNPAGAADWGLQACDRMEAMGHVSWLSTMLAQRGHALYELGLLEEAFAAAERGRELGAEDDLATQMHGLRVEAKVLASRGESERAEALAREAVDLAEPTDMLDVQGDAWFDLALVLELGGKRVEAASAIREAVDRFEQKENLLMAGTAKAWLDELTLSV